MYRKHCLIVIYNMSIYVNNLIQFIRIVDLCEMQDNTPLYY